MRGPEAGPHYICPICRDLIPRPDAFERATFEDVPPKSFGGRPLVLTCKRCNNLAGTLLDAAAHRKEVVLDALVRGRPNAPRRTTITAGDVTVKANYGVRDDATRLEVVTPNGEAFAERVAAGVPCTVNFGRDRFSAIHASTSWLKSAYCALFAAFGYWVVFAPALEPVRRQIMAAHEVVIRNFVITLPGHPPFISKGLYRVTTPELDCWGVQFGPYFVFLPNPQDVGLYARLTQRAGRYGREADTIQLRPWPWPDGPVFGRPVPTPDAPGAEG